MKTEAEILQMLNEIEADERLWYEAASLFSNSILAVEQSGLQSRAQALREVLGLPRKNYFGETPEASTLGAGK